MNNKFLIKNTPKYIDKIPSKAGIYYVLKPKNKRLSVSKNYIYRKGIKLTKKNRPSKIDDKREKMLKYEILYVGSSNDLKRRIRQFYCFLYCGSNSHCGGKAIGQIKQLDSLIFDYKKTETYINMEKLCLKKYKNKYGRVPFGNVKTK